MGEAMRWAVLLWVSVLVAGCSDGGPDATDDDPFEDIDAGPVAAGKGVIRGIVFDASITPIDGAKVTLQAGGETASNEDGAFTFKDIEPGLHFLSVTKAGYTSVQQSTEVAAGVKSPGVVKVQIQRMPGTEPRAITLFQEGHIVCSIGEPTNDHSCDTSGDQKTDLVFDFEGTPHWIQTEIIWDSTQPAGSNLYVIQGVCGCSGLPNFSQRFDETSGAVSVHVARAGPGFLAEVGAGNESKQVYVDVSASGPALGTGLAWDQSFAVYMTAFYNLEPDESWTFIADGEYPVGG